MSGTKLTTLHGSRQREARQRLGPFVPLLQGQAAACASMQASAAESAAELNDAVRSIRAELARFSEQAGTRRDMLDAARSAELTVARLGKSREPIPDATEFERVLRSIEGLVAGASSHSIETVALRAHELLSRGSTAETMYSDMRSSIAAIHELIVAAKPADSSAMPTAATIAAAAARLQAASDAAASKAIQLEADSVAAMSPDAQLFQTLPVSEHATLIAAAMRAVTNGDQESATAELGRARELRLRAEHRAAELRQKIIERDIIAAELANALQERNYDKCHVYLQEPAQNETVPLVIYAHNPLNSGHIRVTLALDGQMTVAVDGVAEGEEQMCLDALRTITDSLARLDETVTIQDLGRAAYLHDRARLTTTRTELERGR